MLCYAVYFDHIDVVKESLFVGRWFPKVIPFPPSAHTPLIISAVSSVVESYDNTDIALQGKVICGGWWFPKVTPLSLPVPIPL